MVTAASVADPTKTSSAQVTVTTTPPPVVVTVSPNSASLQTGGMQQFNATVAGSSNTAVNWSATAGTISATGLYTAPNAAGTYNVKATSAADSTKSASAQVTVAAPAPPVVVSISPTSASLQAGGTQQFNATVTGSSNIAVNWSATAGTVSVTGFYTAPGAAGTYTVRATSAADSTKSASSQVIVTATPPPVVVTVSPTAASIQTGSTQQFTAAVTGSSNTSVNWSTTGGTVSAAGLYTAPDASGTYTVTATSAADSTKSASAQVTVTAAPPPIVVTISPSSASLQTGSAQQFSATVTGTTNTSVTWSGTGGTVSSTGFYTAPNTAGTYSVTATSVADPTKSASATVTVTTTSGATGPLRPVAGNPRWFTDGSGKAIVLSGSHTWNTLQDTDQTTTPAAFDFTRYVTFLKSHGHNVTILWKKDLPTYCNWGAGGTWHMSPWPWQRTGGASGTQLASDGLKAFDLSLFDQSYFDRLRARTIQLQQNGIYAIVELFDGLGLISNRCSGDGYPFSAGNNVNGIDDGGGTNSMTMTAPNSITNYQDAYVQKVIDALNDLPNVLWEVSEEAPDNSTWWQGHIISLIHSYETGKSLQHPVGFPTLQVTGATDSTLYNSNADWVAPGAKISPTSSCGSGTPGCKVNINDSDHSYFGMWNDSSQTNRNYLWENFANGNGVVFMDPYFVYWSSGNRNLCQNPVNGVCGSVDTRWDNLRSNMGAIVSYGNRMNLAAMTPQPSLSSTGYCLAKTGTEYLVYETGSSSSFTVTMVPATYAFEWFSPASLTTVSTGTIAVTAPGNQSFTKPFSGDAVLYLKAQ